MVKFHGFIPLVPDCSVRLYVLSSCTPHLTACSHIVLVISICFVTNTNSSDIIEFFRLFSHYSATNVEFANSLFYSK